MPSHRMKRIARPSGRIVFRGELQPGAADHDYCCGSCGDVILKAVGLRQASSAVFECASCSELNVVIGKSQPPDEVLQRLLNWYGPSYGIPPRERRKQSRRS